MSPKILLITPPYHAGVVEAAGTWPHLGFIYLAGHVRAAGYEVEIYDAMSKNHTLADIREKIAAAQPDYVGSTAYTASINDAVRVLQLAKEVNPRIITCLGGIHANFCYRELLADYGSAIDFVVRGEGEETMPELIRALTSNGDLQLVSGIAYLEGGRVVATNPRPFITDLDSLLPAWDLVDWEDYRFHIIPGSRLGLVSSSRGCVNDCNFCSQQKFWQKQYRQRKAANFVAELAYLKTRFGVDIVMLADEYPTRSRTRWENILDLLIEQQLKIHLLLETCVADIIRDADIMDKYRRAGVVHIYVGVEATNQDRLDYFKKNIKCEQSREAIRLINDAGMISECSFVLGMPDETPAKIEETLELAKYYNPDFAHFLMLAPWPYADIYEELKDYVEESDFSKYNFVEPVLRASKMSRAAIAQAVIDCYRRYYMARLPDYQVIQDEFKREYMLRSMRVMLQNSFLKKFTGSLGTMPEEIARMLAKI